MRDMDLKMVNTSVASHSCDGRELPDHLANAVQCGSHRQAAHRVLAPVQRDGTEFRQLQGNDLQPSNPPGASDSTKGMSAGMVMKGCSY